jgi:hypothetical protein
VEQLTTAEQYRLIYFIREKCGFNLTQSHFTEVAFDLFEDISGMEKISTPIAMEIINILWKKYSANTYP